MSSGSGQRPGRVFHHTGSISYSRSGKFDGFARGFRPCGACESSEVCRTSSDAAQQRRDDFSVGKSATAEVFVQDSALLPSRPASSSFLAVENGFVTVTPFHVKPSCKSSERRRRQPASAAAERTTASQMLSR